MPQDFTQTIEEANRRIVEELCQPLLLTHETLSQIKKLFLKNIKLGLDKITHSKAVVKCFLTYVQNLPSGCEKGRCLVLDLGGSNFRIMLMTLNAQMKYKITSKKFNFPENLLQGSGVDFFNYVAMCLSNFVKKLNLHMEELPLAFSIAFPTRQYGLHMAELVSWGKNFNLPDVVGRNVVELLQQAVERRDDIKISTYALMNDTTAVLMSCAFKNPFCKIAVIVDNGCNACYLEQVKYITTFRDTKTIPTIPNMIINTEWAFFGDNGSLEFIRTKWDRIIDVTSATKAERTFEKMVSGLYLGPLVRLILMDGIKTGALLQGIISPKLQEEDSFKTSYIFDIESQCKNCHYTTQEILSLLGYENPTKIDCSNLRFICECISKRSADLVSATLACLIDRIGDPFVCVGIEGNIFRNHSKYEKYLEKKLRDLTKTEHKFKLMVSEVGTGCGAALVALVAKHNKDIERNKSKVSEYDISNVKDVLKRKRNIRTKLKFSVKKKLKIRCHCK